LYQRTQIIVLFFTGIPKLGVLGYQPTRLPFIGGKRMAPKQAPTRREILKGAASATAAASLGALANCFPSVGGTWPEKNATCGCSDPDGGVLASVQDSQPTPVEGTSTVVDIQRDDSFDGTGKTIQPDVVYDMVNQVLSTLAGGASNPWPVLLPTANPCTRIGLKVNCLNRYLPTSPAVVRAIIKSLVDNLQVCPANIVVWDRTFDDLTLSGKYTKADLQGATLRGTTGTSGGTVGPGYSDTNYGTVEGLTPRLSRILTEETDITINCPVLKSHGVSGVTAGLKNIYGIIDIPSQYHTTLPTALPALYRIPQIRNSIKLTIVDALQAVTLADTADRPDSKPGRIFASLDPLALDRYALVLLNQLRDKRGKAALEGSIVSWLDNGYQLGLGTKDYSLVQL
jgi:uncharacterized protein (DUF362 family)